MGELKPCPFCNAQPVPLSQLKAYEQSTAGRFRCENTADDCPIAGLTMTSSEWNTRPRTEGRGEGEHADQLQDVLAALYKAWPDAEDIPSDWPLGIIGCIEQIIAERDAALASPIREPEISRTALIETMRQHIKADAVGLAPAVIAHCLVGFEEAADAILNLAPVGGRGEGSSRSCVESSLRCAPERVCAEALGKLIRYFEGGGDHDAGAFDESCPDCAALEEARDVLSSYETDGSARDLAEQLESWRKLIRRGLLEVRDHDALEGVLSAAAKELSPNTGG